MMPGFIQGIFQKWMDTLTKPTDTFRKEVRNANLMEGAKQLIIAGLIGGFIAGIISLAKTVSVMRFFSLLIGLPIVMLIGWIIGSAILYVVAKILAGKGNFAQQSYLIALYTAPLGLIFGIISEIPIVWIIVSFIIGLVSLVYLTIALREAHKITTLRAILIWFIPGIVVAIIALILVAALAVIFATYLSRGV